MPKQGSTLAFAYLWTLWIENNHRQRWHGYVKQERYRNVAKQPSSVETLDWRRIPRTQMQGFVIKWQCTAMLTTRLLCWTSNGTEWTSKGIECKDSSWRIHHVEMMYPKKINNNEDMVYGDTDRWLLWSKTILPDKLWSLESRYSTDSCTRLKILNVRRIHGTGCKKSLFTDNAWWHVPLKTLDVRTANCTGLRSSTTPSRCKMQCKHAMSWFEDSIQGQPAAQI